MEEGIKRNMVPPLSSNAVESVLVHKHTPKKTTSEKDRGPTISNLNANAESATEREK